MRPAVALLAALGAVACNSQGGNNGQAAAAPGAATGQAPAAPVAVTMRPGLWEVTSRVMSVSAPNAPPEVQQQLQANASQAPTVERNCVTPAEAADLGSALRDQMIQAQSGYSCSTGDSVFANGRIRMSLNCQSNSGAPSIRQAMVGSYTAESLQLAVSAETSLPGSPEMQPVPVRIESTMFGRRVGECPSGAANQPRRKAESEEGEA